MSLEAASSAHGTAGESLQANPSAPAQAKESMQANPSAHIHSESNHRPAAALNKTVIKSASSRGGSNAGSPEVPLLLPDSSMDLAVLHRIVLFLGQQKSPTPSATWDELIAALQNKHPNLSKTQLRNFAYLNRSNLVYGDSGKVWLCKLDQNFLQNYFELAEVAKVNSRLPPSSGDQAAAAACRLNRKSFKFSNSILGAGVACVASCHVAERARAVIVQLGGTSYSLEHGLEGTFDQGEERLSATLRIRNVVNVNLFTI